MVMGDGNVVIQIDADASDAVQEFRDLKDAAEELEESLDSARLRMRELTRQYTENQTESARLQNSIRELRAERGRENAILRSLAATRRRNGALTREETAEFVRALRARNRLTMSIRRETEALRVSRAESQRLRRAKDSERRAIDRSTDAINRNRRALRSNEAAVRRAGVSVLGFNLNLGSLEFLFNRVVSAGFRFDGLLGFSIVTAAHLARGGVRRLVDESDELRERFEQFPELIGRFRTALIGVAVGVGGLVASFAALVLSITQLSRAVERIDQVAIAAPTLSDREIQQFAFAGRALGLQGEDIARSAQFIQTGAQRGLEALRVPEEERTPAQNRLLRSFGFFGVTPQQLLEAEAGQAYITILRRIEERGVQNPEVITNLLPLTGGEQRRATQLASRARERGRIESLFGVEPISDNLDDLRRIPRAIGRITAEFERLFATIGASSTILAGIIEWTADFLSAAADMIKRMPLLGNIISIVLVGSVVLLTASLIKAAAAAGLLTFTLSPWIGVFLGIGVAVFALVRIFFALRDIVDDLNLSWEKLGLNIQLAVLRIRRAFRELNPFSDMDLSRRIDLEITSREQRLDNIQSAERQRDAVERARERFELPDTGEPLGIGDFSRLASNAVSNVTNIGPIEIDARGADQYEVENAVNDGIVDALRSQPFSR